VSDLVPANTLSPDLRFERIANERRPGSLSGSGYFVDELEKTFVDGHLNCLHGCGFQCGSRWTSYTSLGYGPVLDLNSCGSFAGTGRAPLCFVVPMAAGAPWQVIEITPGFFALPLS
jgi:hypothetical protein